MTVSSGLKKSDFQFTNRFLHVVGLLLVLLVALFVRIDPILTGPLQMRMGFGPFGDSVLYNAIAYNLYAGNGYSGLDDGSSLGLAKAEHKVERYEPAVTRGPLYPGFMAAVYRLWGDPEAMKSIIFWHYNWNRVRIVQSILDASICLLLFFTMRTLYPGRYLPALLAAVIYTFSFYNIYYARALLAESVTTFLVALALAAGVVAMKSGRLVWWFVFGASFGLASLGRPEYILFPFFMAGFNFFVLRHDIKKAMRTAAVLLCGMVVVLTPWTVRNYMTFRQFVPTSVGAFGYNLHIGTFETGDWKDWGYYPERIFKSPEMKTEVLAWRKNLVGHLRNGTIGLKEYDQRFKALALDEIKDNPVHCLKIWFLRLPRLWYQNYIDMYDYPEPSGGWFIFYFISSVAALIQAGKRLRFILSPVVLLFIYMNLVYLPLHIEPRYGVPIYPGMCLLAAIGLWLTGKNLWGLLPVKSAKREKNPIHRRTEQKELSDHRN